MTHAWELWNDGEEVWDHVAASSPDCTVFHLFSWGEHKKSTGWLPVRYKCISPEGRVSGLMQLLIKKLPLGLVFIWSPGGGLFRFERGVAGISSDLLRNLFAMVRKEYPRSLIRFHSHCPNDAKLSFDVSRICHRPFFKINSGYTVLHSIEKNGSDVLRNTMSAKHRYYTKKATNVGLTWRVGNDDILLEDLSNIHAQMITHKQIDLLGSSAIELREMRNALRERVMILVGYLNERPVTACLVQMFKRKAFYMVAATNSEGRKVSAAYAMVERLFAILAAQGITQFDFGGIDPVNELATGVNHFKCGFGGELVEHLGEWESASSDWVRVVINIAIRIRRGKI